MKQSNKRNYVRRRRYLQDSINRIQEAIDFLAIAKGEQVDPEVSMKQATDYAQRIEAACWSSHSQITADGYQKSMETKTKELMYTLLQANLSNMGIDKLQKIMTLLNFYRSNLSNQSISQLPEPTLSLDSAPSTDSAEIIPSPTVRNPILSSAFSFLTRTLNSDVNCSQLDKDKLAETETSIEPKKIDPSQPLLHHNPSFPLPILNLQNPSNATKSHSKETTKMPNSAMRASSENDIRSQIQHTNHNLVIESNACSHDMSFAANLLNDQISDPQAFVMNDFDALVNTDYLNIDKNYDFSLF